MLHQLSGGVMSDYRFLDIYKPRNPSSFCNLTGVRAARIAAIRAAIPLNGAIRTRTEHTDGADGLLAVICAANQTERLILYTVPIIRKDCQTHLYPPSLSGNGHSETSEEAPSSNPSSVALTCKQCDEALTPRENLLQHLQACEAKKRDRLARAIRQAAIKGGDMNTAGLSRIAPQPEATGDSLIHDGASTISLSKDDRDWYRWAETMLREDLKNMWS